MTAWAEAEPGGDKAAVLDGLPQPQRFWAMATVVTAVAMATLDTAIANTALPAIAADLMASPADAVWIVSAYQLAMVATVLPCASLGEVIGHRRVFLAGLVLFTLSSLACGLAWSVPTLAAARVLQGLGASGIMSINTALIRFIYPHRLLGRGLGANALTVALGFVIGPTVASAILSVATWPWLFAINVPLGLLGFFLALPTLPDTSRSPVPFDPRAAFYSAGAFAFLILGIGEAAHAAPPLRIIGEWILAGIGAMLLVRRQGSHPSPILPFDLFKRPVFALSAATSVCSFATQGLAFVALPFLFEVVLHRSQVETGFLITPWPVVVGVMAPIAGRLSDRLSAGLLGGVGLAMLGLGMASLTLLPADPTVADIVWRMAVCGAGFGFFQAPNLRAIMAAAPPGRSGGASGVIATSRLLGQSIGAASAAACFGVAGQHGPTLALGLGGGFAGAACLASFARLRLRDRFR